MSKIELLELDSKVSIASPYPCLYIKNENILIVADLHLGLEDNRAEHGVHIPRSFFSKINSLILEPIKELKCKKIILLGDVKHEFGKIQEDEWWSIKRLFRNIRELNCEPEVIQGNHDNHIIAVLKELKVKHHKYSLEINSILLAHGHRELGEIKKEITHVIIGNEHPAISISDENGIKYRFKAFITGQLLHFRLTVIPSISPLFLGTEINNSEQTRFLSPILRKANISEFTPYLIEPMIFIKKFPLIKNIRDNFK